VGAGAQLMVWWCALSSDRYHASVARPNDVVTVIFSRSGYPGSMFCRLRVMPRPVSRTKVRSSSDASTVAIGISGVSLQSA